MTSLHIWATSAIVLNLVLPPCAAAQAPPVGGGELRSPSHVRTFDKTARRVVDATIACSATVARMVATLEASDVIVGIEARPFLTKVNGETRILAAVGGVRYLRIRLRTPNTVEHLMRVLGHELYHATELARAADVRDAATQRAFCLRVGWERSGGGRYETQAAIDAERLVASDVASCRGR